MKAWKLVVGGAIAASLGLAAWFVASRLERYGEDLPTGFRGEARRNPLLALERMFARLGVEAESRTDIDPLPAPDRAVVWMSPGDPLAPERERELAAWIERGGSLVLLAPSTGSLGQLFEQRVRRARVDLPLQGLLGFAYRSTVDDEKAPEAVDEDDPGEVVQLEGHRGPLEVAVHGRVWLEDESGRARVLASDAAGARALSYELGSGRATIVASQAWATNLHVGERDHARAARELSDLGGPRTGVVLVHGETRGGLLARIARTGWTVLASLAAWLALWLWHRGSRFGPRIADAPPGQRAFGDHVVASGEFLWRHGASQALLAAPRRELRAKIQRRRPDLEELDAERLHSELGRLARVEPGRVAEALSDGPVSRPDDLARVARTLVILEECL